MSATNPPDSPPKAPVIPEGLATKLGKLGVLILTLVAAIQPFLDGNHDGDARFYAALATAVGIATILGRMLQAAASYLNGSIVPTPQPKTVVQPYYFTGSTGTATTSSTGVTYVTAGDDDEEKGDDLPPEAEEFEAADVKTIAPDEGDADAELKEEKS